MINLGRCLVYLLERHDRVAVGGIGTFRKIRQPGYFDGPSHSYHPPFGEIVFDADAGTGEGAELVVDYVAAQRRVSRSAAQASYRKSIAGILKQLDAAGQVALDGLGQLRQDADQLTLVTLGSGDRAFPAMPPVPELPVLSEPIRPEPAQSEQESVEVEEVVEPRGGVFWRVAAILVIILGALLAASALLRPDLIQDLRVRIASVAQSSTVPTEPVFETTPVEASTPAGTLEALSPDTIESVDVLTDTTAVRGAGVQPEAESASGLVAETEPVVTYEIIVASFKTMEQAHTFVAEMKEKGIELRAIDSRQPRNRKKVSYGSYPTKDAAYQELPNVQKTLEPTAWVDRIVR